MKYVKQCLLSLGLTLAGIAVQAQVKTLTLEDMSAFKSQAGNWRIVGDVTIDPTIDVHQHEEESTAASEPKKKSKKSKDQPASSKPEAVVFQAGKGILLNMNDNVTKDNLVTAFEHGDIELELEVMIPKGSNSGIYLQGRYEVQLLDSWGVKDAKFSDIGGIYRNWEQEKDKIYMGKAPLSNPAKAPGLWQKMKISFRAPRFDAAGKKIANARFVSVELNGVKIHDNVEVPLPTGGPIENNEKAFGPIMIQGDHGPVAFRNIQYKLMREITCSLSNIAYKTYYGNFKTVSDFTSLKPSASGSLSELTCEVLENENAYGSSYAGNITIPEDGTYDVTISFTGGGVFTLNNQKLADVQQPSAYVDKKSSIVLKAGTYLFEIYNYKDASWMPPRLGMSIESASSYKQILNAYNSFPPDNDPTSPILINPGSEPRLLRAFLDFKNDYSQRLTHTIGVGDPSGTHYVYDMKSGNLVCVWHGKFVDATPMWHDRGDGSFKPLGAVQYLFNNEPLAFISSATDAFPVMLHETQLSNTLYKGKGYRIDEATSRPVFLYSYDGIDVTDQIYPDDQDRIITHEVSIKNRGTKPGLHYKIAEGKSIVELPNGLYAIDDKQYYIKVSGAKPTIREIGGKKELIIAIDSSLKYSIIW